MAVLAAVVYENIKCGGTYVWPGSVYQSAFFVVLRMLVQLQGVQLPQSSPPTLLPENSENTDAKCLKFEKLNRDSHLIDELHSPRQRGRNGWRLKQFCLSLPSLSQLCLLTAGVCTGTDHVISVWYSCNITRLEMVCHLQTHHAFSAGSVPGRYWLASIQHQMYSSIYDNSCSSLVR